MSIVERIRTPKVEADQRHDLRTHAQNRAVEFHSRRLETPLPLVAEHDGLQRLFFTAWRVLTRRTATILSLTLLIACLCLIYVVMQPRLFTATTRLQIDERPSQVVQAGNVMSQRVRDIYDLRTLYKALQSRSLAERVVSELNLADDHSFIQLSHASIVERLLSKLESTKQRRLRTNKMVRRDRAARVALANQRVRPVAGSRLVDISFTDHDPERAARVTDGFAQAFIRLNQTRLSEANAYAKSFLKSQLNLLESELRASEAKLLDFAKTAKVLTVKNHASVAERQLVSASTALETLVTQRIKKQQQWKQIANGESADGVEVPTNALIDGLRAKRSQLVTEYEGKLSTFKPSYPTMIQIKTRIGEINRQILAETKSVRRTIKAAYETSLRQEEDMKEHIKELRNEVMNLQQRSIRYNILKRELATKRELYDELLRRYKQVDIAAGVISNNVFVIDAARRPSKPSSPNILRAVLVASCLGLALGFGIAFLQEIFDDRIVHGDDVEERSGLRVLGSIPRVKGSATAKALSDHRSVCSRSYRALATELIVSNNDTALKPLLISSAFTAEGKSTTALALAREIAMMGLKVLLIDADLGKPSLHTKLNCPNKEGLTDFLSGSRGPAEILQATDLPYLAFIASGPMRPGATTLLTGPDLTSLLSDAGQVFDAVILDGPAVLESAHAQLIANATHSALMVVSAGSTRFRDLRDAQKRFHFAQCQVIGVALTKTLTTRSIARFDEETTRQHSSRRRRETIAPNLLATPHESSTQGATQNIA